MSYNYQPLKHFEQQQHQKKQKVVGQKQEKVRIPIVIVIVIACFLPIRHVALLLLSSRLFLTLF